MNVRLILTFSTFLGILWLDLVFSSAATRKKLGAGNLRISDPELEQSFDFFTKTLSNSEKENLIKLNSSSEYARSTVPKGAGYDYTVQTAIYTLSESLYISPNLFNMKIISDHCSKKNIFEVVDCLYSVSKKTLKLLKLVRQRCFHHTENSHLNIFPRQVALKLKLYCDEFKRIEIRYARLSDFIYLLKMILKKSKIHNSNLLKLSKLVWKIIKSPSFKKIKFVKDLSSQAVSPKPKIQPSKKEAATISKISTLLRHIDNTLLEKVKILPFWITKSSEEYSVILIETEAIVDKIWSPMKKNIVSNLKSLNQCTSVKKKSYCPSNSPKYKLSKDEKFIQNIKKVSEQIRSDIE
ncbi:uncharacterized protein cubi_00360 [Cryptosporidium ubiquitum]|uniref:Secreted protein n=1 Tax=Cryptosporidium ubiquitum TaxID=857276 RepID=A0A1J4ML93_9CRYT|nr:uncharacterized protein cubi_00360 [Cryptosporidium ubiquitum]OII74807.1 hypothetical protein cubi_00360 [Cryptosporidium ubiquitum]